MRRGVPRQPAYDVRGNAEQDQPGAGQRLLDAPAGGDVLVESDAGEVLRVEAAVADVLEDVGLDAPELGPVAVAGDRLGEGGAHIPRAEDGDGAHRSPSRSGRSRSRWLGSRCPARRYLV